ncbi:MAG: hypothetical protein IKS59_02900 [Aeriscardovia sp.]|nr:hypothetical protein [Aeriscardovia sp.]
MGKKQIYTKEDQKAKNKVNDKRRNKKKIIVGFKKLFIQRKRQKGQNYSKVVNEKKIKTPNSSVLPNDGNFTIIIEKKRINTLLLGNNSYNIKQNKAKLSDIPKNNNKKKHIFTLINLNNTTKNESIQYKKIENSNIKNVLRNENNSRKDIINININNNNNSQIIQKIDINKTQDSKKNEKSHDKLFTNFTKKNNSNNNIKSNFLPKKGSTKEKNNINCSFSTYTTKSKNKIKSKTNVHTKSHSDRGITLHNLEEGSISEYNSINIDEEFETSEIKESSEEYESLGKLQLKKQENDEPIIIKKIESNLRDENIKLDDIKLMFKKKNYEGLDEYSFSYMTQSIFNHRIYKTSLKEFRDLFFRCPKCDQVFRNFSLPGHIFQFHFETINEYLTDKEIANASANLMNKEFNKIQKSLEIYSNLAIIFLNSNRKGYSQCRNDALETINYIKNYNLEKVLNKNIDDARKYLETILPINKNKNKNRQYRKRIKKQK